jgi:hypothetical protein
VSDDVATLNTTADIIEVVAAPYSVTEVINTDIAGVVAVHDSDTVVLDVPEPVIDVVLVRTDDLRGPQGIQGDQGVAGPVGPQGVPGVQGPFAPVFEQHFAAPQLVWLIEHNLGVYPVVTTVDLNNEEITGDVATPDKNTVVVTFDVPVAGTARLKA